VKVADFGLARLPQMGDAVHLTQAGMTMGTPLYMSPEQVEGGTLDPRSDLYSFGVTCYHMLAGSPPFEADNPLSVAVQHLKKQPESLENRRRDLPPALCRVVHKMLAKAPENRYQSARELLRELRQVQSEHLEEEWPEDLPGWDMADLDLAGTSRAETTQRLGTLMKAAGAGRTRLGHWLLGAACVVVAFVAGSAVALLTVRKPYLLAEAQTAIPEYTTAEGQWLYATETRTEEAFQAVIDRFPGRADLVQPAKKQLAWIYVRNEDFPKATAIFDEFDALEDEPGLRAFGLAGKLWISTRQKKYADASELFNQLRPIRRKVWDDPLMPELLRHALGSLEQALQTSLAAPAALNKDELNEWNEWFDQLSQPTEEAD
jgi:serine/threonine-protein kinase